MFQPFGWRGVWAGRPKVASLIGLALVLAVAWTAAVLLVPSQPREASRGFLTEGRSQRSKPVRPEATRLIKA